jgi:hypothetical protein
VFTKAHGRMKIDADERISSFPQIGETGWRVLEPGQEHHNLLFEVDRRWTLEEDYPLDLRPGKNTVKIIFAIQPTSGASVSCIQLLSNPVEIEIVPTG